MEGVQHQHSSSDDTEDKDDVVFYKWDFKRLDQLFDEPRHGLSFRNAIFSLWLKGVAEYIVNLDQQLYEEKRLDVDAVEAYPRNQIFM